VVAYVCVDQTCLLTNAPERDKRSSPGIPGTVWQLNVLGTEAVDSHLVRLSLASCKLLVRKDGICLNFSNLKVGI